MEVKAHRIARQNGKTGSVQVTVVVLFFHGDRWAHPCVSSLLDQSMDPSRYELILADNGGATPSLDGFKDEPNVRIVRWQKNLGFAGGNNRAAALARGRVVLLLNQDVVVHHRCLEALLSAFDNHPELDVISTNMQMVARLEEIERRRQPPSSVGLFRLSPFGHADYRPAPFGPAPVSVDFVSGNGLAFRKPFLSLVGGYLFDERLFNYAEDLDLSLRISEAGGAMSVLPEAVIYHLRDDPDAGTVSGRLKKFVHISGNRLLVYRRRLSGRAFLRKLPLLLAGVAIKVGRMDGDSRFKTGRFLAGAVLAPLTAIDFLKKSLRQKHLPPCAGSWVDGLPSDRQPGSPK